MKHSRRGRYGILDVNDHRGTSDAIREKMIGIIVSSHNSNVVSCGNVQNTVTDTEDLFSKP